MQSAGRVDREGRDIPLFDIVAMLSVEHACNDCRHTPGLSIELKSARCHLHSTKIPRPLMRTSLSSLAKLPILTTEPRVKYTDAYQRQQYCTGRSATNPRREISKSQVHSHLCNKQHSISEPGRVPTIVTQAVEIVIVYIMVEPEHQDRRAFAKHRRSR